MVEFLVIDDYLIYELMKRIMRHFVPFRFFQIQEAVLGRWVNDAGRMDRRTLALVILAHAADVLENAFAPLSDDDYEVAMRRVRTLLDLDFEVEATKRNANPVLWAVFAAFTK